MKNAVDINIKGIKCDNPDCDFKDDNVKVEDYDKWLNKPCPKCGSNLLTESDYNNVKFLLKMTSIVNKIFPKRKNNDKDIAIKAEMNGSGNINFKSEDV